jgi:hypothetical protein
MRDVERSHGRFGFDEYIEHLISFLEVIGGWRACARRVPALRRRGRRRCGNGARLQFPHCTPT